MKVTFTYSRTPRILVSDGCHSDLIVLYHPAVDCGYFGTRYTSNIVGMNLLRHRKTSRDQNAWMAYYSYILLEETS